MFSKIQPELAATQLSSACAPSVTASLCKIMSTAERIVGGGMWSEADKARGGAESFTRGFTGFETAWSFYSQCAIISINVLSVPLIRPCTRHTTKDML